MSDDGSEESFEIHIIADSGGDSNENEILSKMEEAEERAQKALAILQSKDEELARLQSRLCVLEKVAERLQDSENSRISLLKLPLKKLLQDQEKSEFLDETLKSFELCFPESPLQEESVDKNWESSSQQEDSGTSVHVTNEQLIFNCFEIFNSKLQTVISHQNEIRLRDKKRFCQTLDKFHQMLQVIKSGSKFELVIDSVNGFQSKKDDFSQSLLSEAINNVNNHENEEMKTATNTQISSENPSNDEQNSKNNEKYMSDDLETDLEENISLKLKQIDKDFKELNLILTNLNDQISKEQQIKRTMQSAWCARFKVQLNKMERLSRRYYKICKFLMDARQSGKVRSQKKKLEKNTKSKQEELNKLKQKEERRNNIEHTGLLQGRLVAAQMVMNNQKEEIKSLQQQMDLQNNQIHNLRQRLLMSVAQSASKESLAENNAKQCQESEEKRKQTFQQYSALKKEAQVMQCTLIGTQDQLTALKVDYDKVKEENNTYAAKLTDCKTRYENQITQLSEQLQKERLEKQEVEVTVDQLHKQLKKQTEIASERIKKANKKLKEFFKTIQVFLELACKANSSSCFHFEQAERIAARIFNIPSKDVQKITNLITNLPELQDRIEYSKSLVGKDEFSKEMAQFLYSVTLSSKNVSI